MKILIIDSHKSVSRKFSSNLHLQNAKIISDRIGAKLIWSYKGVNDEIEDNFDAIVFNHSSFYSFIDFEWVERSPNAKLFYILNDFAVGEPHCLWNAVRRLGRTYEVIASHSPDISKVVTKYISNWHWVDINSLIFDPTLASNVSYENKEGGIYYGSYRKHREPYFQKYLNNLTVSTHSKNRDKFLSLNVSPKFINRIAWDKEGLSPYKTSLYIEDTVTNNSYCGLANRFYEALNYKVVPLFDESCDNTLLACDYHIPADYVVNSAEEFAQKTLRLPENYELQMSQWRLDAGIEREMTLKKLENILVTNL